MSVYQLQKFPMIQKDGRTYYGGDQEWFHGKWQRLAGCASVCAANLAAYDQIGIAAENEVYSLEVYLQLMNEMYHLMTPGVQGYPHVAKFADAYVKYAQDHGVTLKREIGRDWHDLRQPLEQIEQTLLQQEPVALLVLNHSSKVWQENVWHWMTITGYSSEDGTVTLSNCGERETYDASVLLDPNPKNQVRLASFFRIA
ncbi:MAG: hypothetical protein LKF79_07115 [Solobacterium sp.]|nr:hypothetical protein [Solobacterium sp.]MCH4223199.1 hypothetical protein [Solobacterium sp.]MCH4266395.1 hypothetical protein [Solobacterium sp.]